MKQIVGSELLQQIEAVWQPNAQAVEEIDNGFNWWPGHHKVTVRCLPTSNSADPNAWRLSVTTEFLESVNFEDPKIVALITSMGSFSPGYGWVYTPPENTSTRREWI